MTNYYTIVQYVPDPVTGEKVNVGVIGFDEDDIGSIFVRSWKRVEQFGDENIDFLKDFARRVEQGRDVQPPLPSMGGPSPVTASSIREWAGHWVNSIQFTEPRATTLPIESILQDLGSRFLREVPRKRRLFRDKRVAVSAAKSGLSLALVERGREPEDVIEDKLMIAGALTTHEFDVGIANGTPLLAIEALSFEGTGHHMKREVDATAWSLDDVGKAHPELDLAVVTLPPKTARSTIYNEARKVFEGLHADVVEEDEVDDWSMSKVKKLLERI